MKLSKNNQLVYDALVEAGRPMGAYDVIDAVRPAGISAPPTVYRALNKLIELGIVHRIESRNAFVICNGSHEGDATILLMLCNACGKAEEFADPEIGRLIAKQASGHTFAVRSTILEVQGLCAECQTAAPSAEANA